MSGDKAPLHWYQLHALMDELRAAARSLLRLERDPGSLQATALVLSALRRQVPAGCEWDEVSWPNRSYFFGAMYRAMRRALIDHARARGARKRRAIRPASDLGLCWQAFDDLPRAAEERPEQIEALERALDLLGRERPEWAELVQHRFHGGLTIEQTARVMEVSEKTVRRWWERARLFLAEQIRADLESSGTVED